MRNKRQRRTQTGAPKGSGKTARKRKANMWYVVSAALLGVCFAVALGIALKSDRLVGQFWWGVVALIFAILGLAALVQYYVIGQRPVPTKDREIVKRAVNPSVVASLTLNKKLVAEEIVEVNLTFLNGGGSTAENLAGEVGFVYQNKPSRPEAKLCATGTTFGPINLLRGAQIPILIRGLTPLPAVDLVAIEGGREWLFFCGKASYEGIDGNVPIDLCWVYRRETKTFTDCSDLNNPHNRNTNQAKPN